MGRAFLLFGAAVTACWSGAPQSQTSPANQVATAADAQPLLVGAYRCTITDDGYRYPPFPCRIREGEDRGLLLEKLGGSVRFEGKLRVRNAMAYRFEGEVYCPYGDCNEHVEGMFRRRPDGTMVGKIGARPMVVQLYPAGGYGGDGYGGAAYGGAGYGGATYGAVRPMPGP